MWKTNSHYVVAVEVREVFEKRLKEVFASYGKEIKVMNHYNIFNPRDVAMVEISNDLRTVNFHCGYFWNDKDNLCPIFAMTHELGHYLDIINVYEGNTYEYENDDIFKKETNAWLHGFKVCEEIGLLPDYAEPIYQYASFCLKTYYEGSGFGGSRRVMYHEYEESLSLFRKALGIVNEPRHLETTYDDINDILTNLVNSLKEKDEYRKPTPLEKLRKKKADQRRRWKESSTYSEIIERGNV